MIQALSQANINAEPLIITYTPPEVNDCIKVAAGTGSAVGAVIGIEQAGTIVQLATIGTAAISPMNCAARTYVGTTFTYEPFIQMATIQVHCLTANGTTLSHVANALMVLLSLNNNVIFTQQITYH
jgi:hypothetical protein